MIQQELKLYAGWLQKENYKSFYLAFLRVAISVWLLKEVAINWPAMDILYGHSAFIVSKSNLITRLPGGFSVIREHYTWFIISLIVVTFLNILGIGRWFTALLLFSMVHVLQKMNMTFINGGDVMGRLLLFYLIFANSYQYFVLFKQKNIENNDERKLQNLFSNLAAFSIMLQLCVAYFSSGLAKINDPAWLHGEAVYYAFSMERFIGTPFNKYLIQYKWIDIITNYAVLAFELLFPLLVWIKKLRKPLLGTGLLFHAGIYILLMIYSFQTIFVLTYGLFLPNDQLKKLAELLIKFIKKVTGF